MANLDKDWLELDQLRKRISFLEDVNRWHLQALDIFGSLSLLYQKDEQLKNQLSIFQHISPYTRMLCEFEQVGFCSVSEQESSFNLTYTDAEEPTEIEQDLERLIDNGEFAWALNLPEPSTTVLDERTIVLVPISTPSRIRGMFLGYLKDNIEFENRHKRGLAAIIQNCAYAIENAELQKVIREQNHKLVKAVVSRTKELEYHHYHDQLTRLPNRSRFKEALTQAISRAHRTGHMVVVILMDLDMFKRVNESLGHTAGDELLRQVGLRLTKNMRDYDPVARFINNDPDQISHFGGDEFCILLPDASNFSDAKIVLDRLQKDMSMPFIYGKHQIVQTFSAGISFFPDHGKNAEQLLQYADIALYQAKFKGRNQHVSYTPSMQGETLHHLSLSGKLHSALEKKQFCLYYQPQINTQTFKIIGLEALIRWIDEAGNVIPPNSFIPLAEELGLIVPMGEWVIEEACRQIKLLQCEGFDNIPIAVNIAAQQFAQPNFLDKVMAATKASDVAAELLEIELTERVIMGDVEETIKTLNNLHEQGFKISVDDFGTGYSSLSYLKRFPIDTLKIDKSFVDDVADSNDDAAIVTAIAALAKSLHLSIIAEGVETKKQVEFLNSLQCYHAQGYLYSKPLDKEQLINFLKENSKLQKKMAQHKTQVNNRPFH